MTDVANLSGPIEIKITSNISRNTDTNIEKVATALNNLKSSISGVDSVTAQLGKLTTSLRELDGTNLSKATSALNRFQKSIPNFSQAFKNLDFDSLTAGVTKYVAAMTPLATLMSQLAAGFNALPPALKIYTQSLNTTGSATNNFTKSQKTMLDGLRTFRVQALAVIFVANRLAKSFANLVDKANRYIENLNLFTITMGKATNATLAYIETVSQAVGIDPAEWIEHQGVFKQIISGFGVVEERANLMSQNLTQLVYDTTSFFNTSIESSAQRFEAAMAQQSRPLRRYGYDISMTALREEALALGISKTVDEMTRAEKAQLTYIVLMKQSSNIMGDMARTVNTPENALRVLRMQIDMMGRSLGNVLIPMVQAVLPYLIAFAQAVQVVANSLAAWLGFKMPEIDYSGMDTGPVVHLEDAFDDLGGSIGGATAKAKEFKNFVLGFDELHIIPTPGKAGGGGGGLDSGLDDLFAGINLPSYDFLEQLAATDGRIAKLRDKIVDFLTTVGSVVKAFGSIIEGVGIVLVSSLAGKLIRSAAAWFITKFSGLRGDDLQGALTSFDNKVLGTVSIIGGLGLGFVGTMKATERYKMGKINSFEYMLAMSGSVLGSIGMISSGIKLLSPMTSWGSALGIGAGIGIVVAAVGALVGYFEAIEKTQREIAKERIFEVMYGDIQLSARELKLFEDKLLSSKFHQSMKLYMKLDLDVEEAAEEMNYAIDELKATRFYVQMGVDVSLEDYEATIQDVIKGLQAFLKADSQKVLVAIDLVFGADTEMGQMLSEGYSAWNIEKSLELKTLSSKITEVFSDAIKDGFTSMKTDELLEPLYAQLNAIIAEIDRYEKIGERYRFKAEYGVDIDEITAEQLAAETSTQLRQDIRANAQAELEAWSGVIGDTVKAAIITVERAHGELSRAEQDLIAQLVSEGAMVELADNFDYFSLVFKQVRGVADQIIEAIPLDKLNDLENTLDEYILARDNAMARGDYFEADRLTQLIEANRDMIADEKDRLSKYIAPAWLGDEAKGIEGLMQDVELSKTFYQKFREAGVRMGTEELEGYVAGLEIGALALDQYAIDFFEGQSIFSRPEAIDNLLNAEWYGSSLNDAVVDGLYSTSSLMEVAGKGVMFRYFDGLNEQIVEMTPALYQNLKDMNYGMVAETEQQIIEQLFLTGERREIYDRLLSLFRLDPTDISTPQDLLKAISKGVTDETKLSEIKSQLQALFPGETIGDSFVTDFMIEMNKMISQAKLISSEIVKQFIIPKQTLTVTTHGNRITIGAEAQAYATGGYPTAGDLFMANEAGPEFVGLQGRRTVVANNMQIVDGISQGVLEGMLMAATISEGRSDGSGGNLTIQIGDEVIWRKTMDEARREGQRTGSSVVMVR